MSVEIAYWPDSRFGNHLFQYVAARLFAAQHGLRLLTGFAPPNGSNILTIAPYGETGEVVESPTIRVTDDPWIRQQKPALPYLVMKSDQDLFSGNWPRAHYVFEGWFERSAWYLTRRKRIEEFVRPEPIPQINTRDIVINLRVAPDFRKRGWVIHPQWYLDILSRERFDTLHIVTDCRDEDYLSNFYPYSPVIVSAGPKRDWNYVRSFDRIVCANSSFSWWACFFSKASTIYTFKRWNGYTVGALESFPNGLAVDGPFLHENVT